MVCPGGWQRIDAGVHGLQCCELGRGHISSGHDKKVNIAINIPISDRKGTEKVGSNEVMVKIVLQTTHQICEQRVDSTICGWCNQIHRPILTQSITAIIIIAANSNEQVLSQGGLTGWHSVAASALVAASQNERSRARSGQLQCRVGRQGYPL